MATKKPMLKKAVKKAVKSAPKKNTPVKKAAKKPIAKPIVKKTPLAKPKKAPAKVIGKKVAAKPSKPTKKVTSHLKNASKHSAQKPLAKKHAPVKTVPAKKIVAPVKNNHAKKHTAAHGKHDNSPITRPTAKKEEPLKEVKVPKTSVKTSIPYKPDYKPLDQRKGAPKNSVPLVRYTDTELNEFRELILKKYEAAKKELAYLQGLITRKDEMGGDEAESRYMTMEDGSISMEREQLSQMASRQITYIDHLEKALIRIENKTYGICRITGKLIDKARLRAVPHATLSLEAKLGIVKAE